MEYKAFKYFNDKEKMPTDFSLAYYDPTIKTFAYYACSLFIHPDGTYHLEGPDQNLKQEIDYTLKLNDSKIVMTTGSRTFEEGDNKTTAIYARAVGFDDKDFHKAFDGMVAAIAISENYYYTGSKDSQENFVKVESLADIRKLDREQAIKDASSH